MAVGYPRQNEGCGRQSIRPAIGSDPARSSSAEAKRRSTFRVRAFDAIASPREFDKLNRHLGNGRTRVPIAASYPLGKAAQAHRRLDREHVLGRMVFQVRRDRQ